MVYAAGMIEVIDKDMWIKLCVIAWVYLGPKGQIVGDVEKPS